MLEVIKTDEDEIKAVCEYYIVDINGNFDAKGKFVWINEIEVSPKYRNNGCLKQFMKIIIPKVPFAEFGYFGRYKKYPNRKMRIWHRKQWEKLIKED